MLVYPLWFKDWVILTNEPDEYGAYWKLRDDAPQDIKDEFERFRKIDDCDTR
jgi:hypothetical protein